VDLADGTIQLGLGSARNRSGDWRDEEVPLVKKVEFELLGGSFKENLEISRQEVTGRRERGPTICCAQEIRPPL
jgi:hypothetical protein